MKYSDGRQASLGDRVKLWETVFGTIVCSIDDDTYSEDFSREHWAAKGNGVVIKADDGRIFHYGEPDEDFELLERAGRTRVRGLG
jgi:hypothetical protein